MSTSLSLAIVLVLSVVTILIRSLPFLIFPEGKETPQIVVYLSKVLPCAVMGMLIIYCLKEVTPLEYPYGLPEIIAIAATAGSYLWKRNTLLSILGGTVFYMILVQVIF